MLMDDFNDRIEIEDGGGGSGPTLIRRKWLDVNWGFPAGAPNPPNFEVVLYVGSNPADTDSYIMAPQILPGTDRRYVTTVAPNVVINDVKAAVRSIYG
jgi:hypothetical protein